MSLRWDNVKLGTSIHFLVQRLVMPEQVIARESERASLDRIYQSSEAEFIAVYGRRRVGKTFLIRRFFKDKSCLLFQLTGIHNAPLSKQLEAFTKELEVLYKQLGFKFGIKPPESWLDAFELLTDAIAHTDGKVAIFFDEFPWMATKKSLLLEALDYYWNRHWVDNPNLKLVICGSAASWIIENILNNRGGLHNRVTLRLLIKPFSLGETQRYLESRAVQLNQSQLLRLYMCIGGIPFYLKFVEKGLSAVQNIDRLCFRDDAPLNDEFNNLFASLFKSAELHEALVRVLSTKREGIARKTISDAIKIEGGALTRTIRELTQAGFIQRYTPYKQKRGVFYKLIDEYSLFYLTWIEPAITTGLPHGMTENFWDVTSQTPVWRAWAGYAFEAICFKHLTQIQKALNIPDGETAATWRYTPKMKDNISGAQIDLLFDRLDGIVNICEIKYASEPFQIDKDVAASLRNKLDVYKRVTKTEKQLSVSMITTCGLKPSSYTEGLVWSDATAACLFEEV